MSAKNYTECPRCEREHAKAVEAAENKAASSYGKVSLNDYQALVKEFSKLRRKELPESLGEYYEMGFDSDGVFRFRYNCTCDVCGFEFSFKSESQETNLQTSSTK